MTRTNFATGPWLVIALGIAACNEDAASVDTRASDTASADSAPADATDAAGTDAATGTDSTASDTESDTALDAETTPTACTTKIVDCIAHQKTCVVDGDVGACKPCPAGHFPARPDGVCTPIPGTVMHHDFGEVTLARGQEIPDRCLSWVLGNDTELFVNAVEMQNDGLYHHSNWFVVPEGFDGWPTEPWVGCYNEGFNEIKAAAAGGVLYAQSTQVKFELQKFQAGAAVRIPPRSRIITVTHLLNYQTEAKTTDLAVTLYTLPPAEVAVRLTPAQFAYTALAIPPESAYWAGADCNLASQYDDLFSAPLDMKVHYVLPHFHTLGTGFELKVLGGPHDGEPLVELGGFSSDPFGYVFDPPIDLAGATGLSFACGWDNPTADTIYWGIGDQEMCEALMFVESKMAFSGAVTVTSERTTRDGAPFDRGGCGVIGFPFGFGP